MKNVNSEEMSFSPEDFKEVKVPETAVAVVNEETGFIANLTGARQTMFCSLKATDTESKKILFKASNNPEHRLTDHINEVIMVKDIFCEVVDLADGRTGEITKAPRIVLIDEKGEGYQAVSLGVYSAVRKLIAVFGTPTWNEPLAVKVKQITKSAQKKITTLDIV